MTRAVTVRRSLYGALLGGVACAAVVEADEIRAIKQPLIDYKSQCGMQVSPAEALTVLSEL